MVKTIHQAITAHKDGRLKEAEMLYRSILETQPTNLDANNNLAVLLYSLDRFDEAEKNFQKTIKLKPDFAEAYNNLASTLKKLGKKNEAKVNYRKSIELKQNYAEAHNNLGNTLSELGELEEAEICCKKAIELRPNYAAAHNNLGIILKDLHRYKEAKISYKKAIELLPNFAEAFTNLGMTLNELGEIEEAIENCEMAIKLKPNFSGAIENLDIVLHHRKLLLNIFQNEKSEDKIKIDFSKKIKSNLIGFKQGLTSNPFITYRKVEKELLMSIYEVTFTKIDLSHKKDARYGNGRCSDFFLFENDSSIIKNVANDLKNIMEQAVKSEIFIFDSFANIYEAGSGTVPHNHLSNFDIEHKLVKQKYSLTYYLSVGDQNCSEPGNLKVYDPEEEIFLSNGTITIIPAGRMHSAVYGGKKDRIMIGVNFYTLI